MSLRDSLCLCVSSVCPGVSLCWCLCPARLTQYPRESELLVGRFSRADAKVVAPRRPESALVLPMQAAPILVARVALHDPLRPVLVIAAQRDGKEPGPARVRNTTMSEKLGQLWRGGAGATSGRGGTDLRWAGDDGPPPLGPPCAATARCASARSWRAGSSARPGPTPGCRPAKASGFQGRATRAPKNAKGGQECAHRSPHLRPSRRTRSKTNGGTLEVRWLACRGIQARGSGHSGLARTRLSNKAGSGKSSAAAPSSTIDSERSSASRANRTEWLRVQVYVASGPDKCVDDGPDSCYAHGFASARSSLATPFCDASLPRLSRRLWQCMTSPDSLPRPMPDFPMLVKSGTGRAILAPRAQN